VFGPWSGVFIASGRGLQKPMKAGLGSHQWTMYCWVRSEEAWDGLVLISGVGKPDDHGAPYLAVSGGHPSLSGGGTAVSQPGVTLRTRQWHLLAATFDDSKVLLFLDGQVAVDGRFAVTSPLTTMVKAPNITDQPHFGGKIANFTVIGRVLSAAEIRGHLSQEKSLDLIQAVASLESSKTGDSSGMAALIELSC
jgi:Concanavalin A-like lectin/glucanases superfamily